ncbi:hypothetical protein VSDG_00152 [Cytospora chrysosperma]|uniref:Uncharacterized protein n=1 Tax=Cytospora chrysosperma TaxID=252740 RepID=A0A423WPG6_CYTCH|nr:hypothetical protein VSDG_00152 [Valsa sordida]
MLRGRRLPLPQSPRSRWGATAPVSARLFSSTTIPRLDGNRYDSRPPAEQSKPLFSKVLAPGVDWALLHGRHAEKVNPKHVVMSLKGLKPFGAKHVEQFRDAEPVQVLALQEARKRHERFLKTQARRIRRSQDGPGRPEEPWQAEGGESGHLSESAPKRSRISQDSKKENRRSPRDYKSSVGSQVANTEDSLSWRSIIQRSTSETVDSRSQSSSHRRDQPNTLEISISPRTGGQELNARQIGDLKKAAIRNSGFEPQTVPQQVREAINRQVRLAAAGIPSIATLRPSKPVGLPSQYTPTPPLRPPPRSTPPPPLPRDAGSDGSDFPWATVATGPAEAARSLQAEDPILKEAEWLSKKPRGTASFSQSTSRLDMHVEPRFRVLPKRLEKKITKKIGSLEGARTSNVSIGAKAQHDYDRGGPVKAPSFQHGTANSTALQAMEVLISESRSASSSNNGGHAATDKDIKPVESVQPERSIFEQLFAEERPRGDNYWQIANRLKAAFSAVEKNPVSDGKFEQPGWRPQPGQSIFSQLFPDEGESRPGPNEEEWRATLREPLTPPKDSLLISLRNEVRNWVPEDQKNRITGPEPGKYGSHSTVVVISGTSPSLTETDFYRIAPEGKHVEGWAGGLVKVVQARDSITYEPLGQYYLMFYSRPSALAYVDEVNRLHALSRKLLHAPAASGREVARGALDQAPATPQPYLTDEEQAAVRSFTLLSPSIPPKISVRLWNTHLVADLAAKSNIADVVQRLRPEAATPAKVLLRLNPSGGGGASGAGDPGGLTTDELWLTLRDDGRERSAPWVLSNFSTGIMPVKPRFTTSQSGIKVEATPVRVPLEPDDDVYDDESGEPVVGELPHAAERSGEMLGGGGGGVAAVDRDERFNRFILTFTQPAIARRFVRCWHKRVIYDAVLERTVVVDAVALM